MNRNTATSALAALVIALGAGVASAAEPVSTSGPRVDAPSVNIREGGAGSTPAEGTEVTSTVATPNPEPGTPPVAPAAPRLADLPLDPPIIDDVVDGIETIVEGTVVDETAPDGTQIILTQPGEVVVSNGTSQTRTPKGKVAPVPDAGAGPQEPDTTDETDVIEPSAQEPDTTQDTGPGAEPVTGQ